MAVTISQVDLLTYFTKLKPVVWMYDRLNEIWI